MILTREARITGCLLGGMLGDAIGSHFEGSSFRGEFAIPSNLCVTDDTQLTVATCESIIESGVIAPERMARQMVSWFRSHRITGIGSSTLKALVELDAGGHWALVGATGERSAGNGAAMRIAPLAFFLDPDIDSERQIIRDICRITHRNDEAYIGALAVVRTIRRLIAGEELNNDILLGLVQTLPDSNVRDRLKFICETNCTTTEFVQRFSTSGYVADSVPLAILAAINSYGIMNTIQELVHLGGDTDTIASICGQFFGAAHGIASLPMEILEEIDFVDIVQDTAWKLSRVEVKTTTT